MKEPFISALPILLKLQGSSYEAYFVGGSVRDYLIGRPIHDVDIATSATPEQVMKVFSKTIPVGIEHGTIMVEYEGKHYEVTTFRNEGQYRDFRRPDKVSFITSIKEDLSRRDFKMNAIAMDSKEILIDPFNGELDIRNQVIQTVGDATERFNEDPLRMMRALRFVSQLSFKLEESTKKAIKDFNFLLGKISIERITIEFEKLLLGVSSRLALSLLIESELFEFLPGLKDKRKQLKTFKGLNFSQIEKIEECWALFIVVMEIKDVESFLRRWKLSKKLIQQVSKITEKINTSSPLDIEHMYVLGRDLTLSTAKVYAALTEKEIDLIKVEGMYDKMPIKSLNDVQVNGLDLLSWSNLQGGPWVSNVLQKIELAILNGKLRNEKSEIKGWVYKCNLL